MYDMYVGQETRNLVSPCSVYPDGNNVSLVSVCLFVYLLVCLCDCRISL